MTTNASLSSSNAASDDTHAVPGGRVVISSWMIGAAFLPYGLVLSFVIIGMPFLLSTRGVGVERIAVVSAAALSPLFWAAFLSPTVDAWLPRGVYAAGYALASALAVGAALATFAPDDLQQTTILLVLAIAAAVLYLSAVGGWMSEFVGDERRGEVSGWSNAATMGGGSLGTMIVIWMSQQMPLRLVAVLISALVMLGALPLVMFPSSRAPRLRIAEVIAGAFGNLVRRAGQHDVRFGFVLFLTPAGASAALNLFSGLGRDFLTGNEQVILVTGIGSACASVLGALAGGRLAHRYDRRAVFVGGGALAGVCSILMALGPHTPSVFTLGVLFYSAMVGIILAAFTAHSLELIGATNVAAATMLSFFLASLNGASAYMTWLDGLGYRWGGVTGLFLMDGTASLVTAAVLFTVIRRRPGQRRSAEA